MNLERGPMDNLARWIAWRLPRNVVKWATFRLFVNATQGKYSPNGEIPEITVMEALRMWVVMEK